MAINLKQKTFPRLGFGVHRITMLKWELKHSKETKQDYISITFAPTDELEDIHVTNVFEDRVGTLSKNLQAALNKPGLEMEELFNSALNTDIPATYELVNKDGKDYYNWHLGWAKPAPVAPTKLETKATVKRRKA